MKLLKITMMVVACLTMAPVVPTIAAKSIAAAYMPGWKPFWERLANILLRALEAYLDMVIKRGYFIVPVPANPIVTQFNTPEDVAAAAQNGLSYDGHSLTIPQDIVLYVRDNVGVALQKGEYPIDAQGNFQFNLVKVDNPVSSAIFPLPDGSE
jgi:hypothetical protein